MIPNRRLSSPESTDWTRYYRKHDVPEFIVNALLKEYLLCIRKYCNKTHGLTIAEVGGADSCFFATLDRELDIDKYIVVDNNEYGLELTREKVKSDKLSLMYGSIFNAHALNVSADIVISGGLIEHFAPEETRQSILGHFSLAAPGGLVVISCPTPTWIYWSFRSLLESIGKFPPVFERPLKLDEVTTVLQEKGSLVAAYRLWTTILTQMITATQNVR